MNRERRFAAVWDLSWWIVLLQAAPEQFPAEEFPISESKVNMDVNFPGAAFVIVSCKESQSGFRKEWVMERGKAGSEPGNPGEGVIYFFGVFSSPRLILRGGWDIFQLVWA